MDYSIIDYSEEFKPQIFSLFKKTFQKEMSEKFWNWRFEKNPYGKPMIKLAFLNDKLIGNYLVHPIQIEYNQKQLLSLFSMTTMTDPDFSGQGIMTHLANEVYKKAQSMNFNFVFGFANKNSINLFTKKLDFKQLQIMSEFSIDFNKIKHIKSDLICKKINYFDDSFSNLYDEQKLELNYLITPRTKEYLNWRYIQHPEVSYHCYEISIDNVLQGFFVLKIFKNNTCHIVDFYIKNSNTLFQAMISSIASFCKDHLLSNLTLWINRQLPLFSFLENLGFQSLEQPIYFIVKPLNQISLNPILLNYDNWYITMGNSDVY